MIRIPLIRRAILGKRTALESFGIVVALVGVATLIRWAIAGVVPNLTFVTYLSYRPDRDADDGLALGFGHITRVCSYCYIAVCR